MNKRKQPGQHAKRGEGKPQRPPFPDAKDAVEQFNDAAPVVRQLQQKYDKSVISHFEKTGETPASIAGHRLQSRDVAQRFAVEWNDVKRSGNVELMKTVVAKYEVQPQTLDLQTLLDGARNELSRMAVEQKIIQLHARTTPSETQGTEEFSHSPDYRSVTFQSESYTLTSRQAQVVEMLHNAYMSGNPEVGKDHVLEELGTENNRLRDTFRGSGLWGKLIVKGKRRGTVRLNLPDRPKATRQQPK